MKSIRRFTTVVFGVALCCALSSAAFASDYSVVKGDCLWKIARRTLGSGLRWQEIYEANRDQIKDPHWIYPNQVFVIPDGVEEKAEEPAEVPAEAAQPGEETAEESAIDAGVIETVAENPERDAAQADEETEAAAAEPEQTLPAAEEPAPAQTGSAADQTDTAEPAGTLALYGTPMSYDDEENWIARPSANRDEDIFYVVGNSYLLSGSTSEREICTIFNQAMRAMAQSDYSSNTSAFMTDYNVFAPYYRQAGVRSANEAPDSNLLLRAPRTDVYAALDYYFENLNNGRPVRLEAGSGHGEALLKLIREEYLLYHPAYAALLAE